MRKLALDDDILLNIEKPARYIGHEVNSVMKDKNAVDIRFAMCFPDVYEIGMSHLGIQILYDMFNRRDDVWCERVYSPWMDLDKIMTSTLPKTEEEQFLLIDRDGNIVYEQGTREMYRVGERLEDILWKNRNLTERFIRPTVSAAERLQVYCQKYITEHPHPVSKP